jgi:hypothetical protein
MAQDEANNQTWQFSLTDIHQPLIDRIKRKIADGKTVTLMQEKWGYKAKAYSPTPRAEIEAAEAALGFPFPALIREIWLQIGNGGFGPGYGITGVETGKKINDETLIEARDYMLQSTEYLKEDLEQALAKAHLGKEYQIYAEHLQSVYDQWYFNETFIMYCYWGCNVTTIVDCSNPDLPIHALDGDIKPHSSKTLRQFWQD